MSNFEVLVLGGSDVGKTHYAGQLLGRLKHDQKGSLRLTAGGIADTGPLEEVLSRLEEGKSAGHTPAVTWTGVICNLETSAGEKVSLNWPEYAGERLFSIIERRSLSTEWRHSIKNANAWLLFIRPSLLKLSEDLRSRPTGLTPDHVVAGSQTLTNSDWNDNARYTELLQILLSATKQSNNSKFVVPRLCILLSCWDEGDNKSTPEKLFEEKLPMLSAFITSNWHSTAWSVWGLSATEKSLRPDVGDEDYAAQGPEKFGYVVKPGTLIHDTDLTAPIAWLLDI